MKKLQVDYQTKWETVSSREIYRNPWITLREDKLANQNGDPGLYSVVEKSDAVFVIAQTESKEIYLIKEYRHPIKQVLISLPAGAMDRETDAIVAGKRELEEETGLKARTWANIGSFYPAPALVNAKHYTLLATDLDEKNVHAQGELDEEILEVFKVDIQELKRLISNSEIDGPSLSALNIYFNLHN